MKVTKCKNIEAGKGRGRGWVVVGMGESEGRRNEISRYEVKKRRYNEPARGVTKAPVRGGRTRGVQALVNAGMTRGVQHRYGNLVSFLNSGSIQYTIVILSYLKSGRARPDGVQVLIDTGRARRVQHWFSSLVFLSGSVTIQDAVIKFHEILIIDYHFVWAAFFVTFY